ncbi:LOW QUALITY PROTEIN: conserved hypothetical protein, partial [Brucella suis bv. 3 str. 686]
ACRIEAETIPREGRRTSRSFARLRFALDPDLGAGRAFSSFRDEAHRQSLTVASRSHAADDLAFINSVSDWSDE